MNARPSKALVGSWILLGLALGLEAKTPQPESKIQVFVYNYAGVSPEVLARAEQEAARIYARTGIGTQWLDCPLTPDEAAQYPACQLPLSPTRLALRILSPAMAERARLSPVTFGFALFPEDGGFGMIALVCSHCAEELAKGREAMHGVILGHLMAHELGHLLLGVGSHSASGLMHVPWHKKELEKVAQGSMLFTSWEGDKMRAQVLARRGGAQVAQVSGK